LNSLITEKLSSEYTVRPMNAEDTEEIVRLLQTCLGGSGVPRTREFWEWKHVLNPFGNSVALVAEKNDRIIGLRVFARWRWKSGDREIHCVRAVDTVTHPDSRGLGVFSRLTSSLLEEVKKEGAAFVFNTPNKISMAGYSKLGWKLVTSLPIWIRPLRPLRLAIRFLRNRQVNPDSIGLNSVKPAIPKDVIEKSERSMNSEVRIHTNRTEAYLKWRYADIPGFHYQAQSCTEGDSAAAIISRTKPRHGAIELSLSEMIISPDSPGVRIGTQLLKDILEESPADYAVAIAADHTPEQSVLRNSNFIPLRNKGPMFAVRVLNDQNGIPDCYFWSNWRCSIGDMEIF
jgi:GNAT superfamily N-acetyltransferase